MMSDISSNTKTLMSMVCGIISEVSDMSTRLSRVESKLGAYAAGRPVSVVQDHQVKVQSDIDLGPGAKDTPLDDRLSDSPPVGRPVDRSDSGEHDLAHVTLPTHQCETKDSMGLTSNVAFGGLTEKEYMERFFREGMDLYANLIVSLCSSIQARVEAEHGVIYSSGIKPYYNKLKRVLSGIVNHETWHNEVPGKRTIAYRSVAQALGRREPERYAVVNGNTFVGMAKSNISESVLRALQNMMIRLKDCHEVLPEPSNAIVALLSPAISTDSGEFDVDIRLLVDRERGGKAPGVRSSLASSLRHQQVSHYCSHRLSGHTVEESLHLSITTTTSSTADATSECLSPRIRDRRDVNDMQQGLNSEGHSARAKSRRLVLKRLTPAHRSSHGDTRH